MLASSENLANWNQEEKKLFLSNDGESGFFTRLHLLSLLFSVSYTWRGEYLVGGYTRSRRTTWFSAPVISKKPASLTVSLN